MAGLPEIIKRDQWFSAKAKTFLADLIALGEICDVDVGNEQAEEILRETKQLALYNAKLLLRNYREYVWICKYMPYSCTKEPIRRRKTTDEMLEAFRDEYPADHLTGAVWSNYNNLLQVCDLFKRIKLTSALKTEIVFTGSFILPIWPRKYVQMMKSCKNSASGTAIISSLEMRL